MARVGRNTRIAETWGSHMRDKAVYAGNPRRGIRSCRRIPHSGFTYIGVLLAIALMGVALAATGMIWHTHLQREKEKELLFIGHQFRKALQSYYTRRLDVPDRLPATLEELLGDERRFPVQRHLRRIFVDPMTGKAEWGLVRNEHERIVGVYSLSEAAPLKRASFPGNLDFSAAADYRDWKFILQPDDSQPAGSSPGSPGQAADPPTPTAENPVSLPGAPAPPRPKPRLDCVAIALRDAAVCETQGQRWGTQTEAECRTSSQLRIAACERQGGEPPLPPLSLRYQ